jgi:hypothetical protein
MSDPVIIDVPADAEASDLIPPPGGYPPDWIYRMSGIGMLSPPAARMMAIVNLLFTQVTKQLGTPEPGQFPAIECQVVFQSGQAIGGMMSKTEFPGVYRMVSKGANQQGQALPMTIEQYFCAEEIQRLALVKKDEPPPIILGRRD